MPHIIASTSRPPTDLHGSAGDRLEALGWEINANQYRAVHLAARYDDELEWFHQGLKNPAVGIAQLLQIHASTAREWIRVGHSLPHLPRIDAAFRANEVSYAKVRILTRWADSDNEQQLLTLAETRSADRLTTAVAKALDAADPGDSERDKRHHHERSLTSYTRGDGMIVIRLVLPPAIAKMILAIVETLIGRIAQTPLEPNAAEPEGSNIPLLDPPAGGSQTQNVTSPLKPITQSDDDPPADGCQTPEAVQVTLEQLRQRWRPQDDDDWYFPTLAQQGADAFAAFFLGLDVDLTTELIIHVRGDSNTFDDGTPITTNALCRLLDDSFIRLLIHDAERRPINASSRRRHPTTRQKRVVLETHNHECVDCQSTDLLELDHNPPYEQTQRTIIEELEPRCAPCHRARHRNAA